MRNKIQQFTKASRGREWWDFKIAPILGSVYATAILLDIQLISLLTFLPFLLLALVPGAVYVSVINDLTDLEVDEIAGKPNRLKNKPRSLIFATILTCIVIGVSICWFLDPISLILYLGAWIAYSFYSFPPFRLKKRGFAGVLADALGANVFPQLFSIALLSHSFEKDLDTSWLMAVAVWSLFWGIRGIIWHQLIDKQNDKKSNVRTFALRHTNTLVERFVLWFVFPVEVASFLIMLVMIGSYLPFIFIVIYLLLEYARHSLLDINLIVVRPQMQYRLLSEEYYSFFYPISLLIIGSLNWTNSLLLLVLQLVLFPKRLYDFGNELWEILKKCFYAFREFLLGY